MKEGDIGNITLVGDDGFGTSRQPIIAHCLQL